MSQMPNKDFREDFEQFMQRPETYQKAQKCTYHLVNGVHQQMRVNKVPMTQAHYEAAKSSIENGDTICQFVRKENSHVMQSTGSGCVYNGGKLFHTGLAWWQGTPPK